MQWETVYKHQLICTLCSVLALKFAQIILCVLISTQHNLLPKMKPVSFVVIREPKTYLQICTTPVGIQFYEWLKNLHQKLPKQISQCNFIFASKFTQYRKKMVGKWRRLFLIAEQLQNQVCLV